MPVTTPPKTLCVLCDRGRPALSGLWFVQAAAVRRMGRRVVPYGVCRRCADRGRIAERVEAKLLRSAEPGRN